MNETIHNTNTITGQRAFAIVAESMRDTSDLIAALKARSRNRPVASTSTGDLIADLNAKARKNPEAVTVSRDIRWLFQHSRKSGGIR